MALFVSASSWAVLKTAENHDTLVKIVIGAFALDVVFPQLFVRKSLPDLFHMFFVLLGPFLKTSKTLSVFDDFGGLGLDSARPGPPRGRLGRPRGGPRDPTETEI